MTRLLVVHHSPTRATAALSEAAVAGARDPEITGVEVEVRTPPQTDAEALLACDALLICTPANFGYMAGLVKDLFDRTFLHIGGALGDDGGAGGSSGAGGRMPFGLLVHGRYDTEGAVRSVLSIAQALPWSQAAPVLSVLGDVQPDDLEAARELGATLAALVSP